MSHRSVFRPETGVFVWEFLPLALLCAGLLSSFGLAGCGTSCISGVFNPGGTISVISPCVVNKAMGTVSLRLTSSAPFSPGPLAPNFSHVFVTVQGIEASPDAAADENSPDWEELAPELVNQPVQIDLMGRSANSCASKLIHETAVPAFVYRQIRVRLAPEQSAAADAAPIQNACGEVGPHCAIARDGKILPLIFEGAAPGFQIASERMPSGVFRVLPDTETNLTIEFDAFSSLAVPTGDAVRLVPAFSVASAPSCNSVSSSE